MDTTTAKHFADQWIAAWNNHDIESIMAHYAEDIVFNSPFIPLLKFNETGIITNKHDLRRYFEIGLKAYPELYFDLQGIYAGISTLAIHYKSVNNRIAVEVFELNEEGKAVKVFCNYA